MQQDERDAKIIAVLLHRCGGIVTLVRGDFQAVEGKKTMVVGRIGNTVTLELVDE